MKMIIEHYQELSALYYRWSMLFRDIQDNESANWTHKLAADYSNTARKELIRFITVGDYNNE
jgi:hypothetical protein